MKTSGFYPVFEEVTCDLKEKMGKGGGNPHITASYLFGAAWSKSVEGIFTPNKSRLADEICMSADTIRKYLLILVEHGYLSEINGTAYVISKPMRFRFTVGIEKPVANGATNSAEHVGSPPSAEHVGNVPSMSAEIAEHVGKTDTIVLDSSSRDTKVTNMSTLELEQFREIWTLLGLSIRAKSFQNTINKYNDDPQALIEISAAWLDWGFQNDDEFEKLDKPLLVWRIQNGVYPPKEEKPKTWFDDAPANYFDDTEFLDEDETDFKVSFTHGVHDE